MKTGRYLLCFLLMSQFAWAQQVSELEYGVLFTSGLKPSFPQVFVVNREGQIIHHHNGKDPGLKLSIVNNQVVDNQEQKKVGLLKLLSVVPDFSQVDYTLIFVRLRDRADCPPCEIQETVNQKVLASLIGKSTQAYEVNVFFPEIPTQLSKEEIQKRYPYVEFR